MGNMLSPSKNKTTSMKQNEKQKALARISLPKADWTISCSLTNHEPLGIPSLLLSKLLSSLFRLAHLFLRLFLSKAFVVDGLLSLP